MIPDKQSELSWVNFLLKWLKSCVAYDTLYLRILDLEKEEIKTKKLYKKGEEIVLKSQSNANHNRQGLRDLY